MGASAIWVQLIHDIHIYVNNVQYTKFRNVYNVYAVLNLKKEALWAITQGGKIESR